MSIEAVFLASAFPLLQQVTPAIRAAAEESAAAARAKKHADLLRRSVEIAAKEAIDAAATAETAALLAVSEVPILADQLGHSAADRTNELAAAGSSRDVIQATNQQIAQSVVDGATAVLPQQALNGIAAPSDEVAWSNLRPASLAVADIQRLDVNPPSPAAVDDVPATALAGIASTVDSCG